MRHVRHFMIALAKRMGYYVGVLPPTTDTLRTHLARVLDALHVNCVVDVGAHHGQFGALVRSTGYRGRLLSFEPVPSSFRVLTAQAAGDAEWRCLQYALGSEGGTRPMYVTSASSCASFLEPSAAARKALGAESVAVRDVFEIEVLRLDAIMDTLVHDLRRPRIFLKMDTQGHDLEVLHGAAGSMDAIVGLQSELAVQAMYDGMPDFRTALDHMHALGFALSGLFPVALDRELRIIELDCIMIRAHHQRHPQS